MFGEKHNSTEEGNGLMSLGLPETIVNKLPTLAGGQVALVGAGPGDPGLLTINAIYLLRQAEVVVYDRLISPEILGLAPASAEIIDAGKSCKKHVLTQDETNAVLVEQAQMGKRVVRLKGGDPFIFGRGGEEVEYLLNHGVTSVVVPGITSAAGCSTYAGFPLTHRDHAQSVMFITGHRKQNGTLALDWDSMKCPERTLVFYMGLSNAQLISDNLQQQGRAASTPAALVERGTTENQRVVITQLDDLAAAVEREQLKSPTMMIIGDVVSLAEKNAELLAEINSASTPLRAAQ